MTRLWPPLAQIPESTHIYAGRPKKRNSTDPPAETCAHLERSRPAEDNVTRQVQAGIRQRMDAAE